MPSRSRSSTLSSLSSHSSTPTLAREHVVLNPDQLVAPTSSPSPSFAPYTPHGDDDPFDGAPKSYKSEHSLRTIRPSDLVDHAADEDEERGALSTRPGAHGAGAGGRRAGPQFVIDLDVGADDGSEGGAPHGRPRSSTFGGIELPPAPSTSSSALLEAEQDPTLPPHGRAVRPSLGRQRSTSVSSLSSLRSLDPALHLGGAPLRERRPMLYAGLQAGALLVVSVLILWAVLKGLLPPIDEADREKVKLPRSFDDLKSLNEVLQVYSECNYWRVMGCYIVVYLFLQTFSVPGSMYLSILGGALWGVLIALPLVCFCVASGALLCYLMSAALGPAVLLHSAVWRARVDAWAARVRKHDDNLVSYLIVLRIAPLPPHWVVNVVAPHLGISVWKFWVSTCLGIAGVTYIHTTIGTTLDQMTSSADFHLISWQNGLGLGGILIPVLLRRAFASDLADAAADPGAEEPREPLLHPRASLSLDADDEGGAAYGTRRELLDGTARSSTDGSARLAPPAVYRDEDGLDGEERGARPVLQRGAGSADKVSRLLGVQVDSDGR
ncbi:hypothetical protein JCM10450v2_006491 [Rhodotorula kratochvilovae]